MTWRLIPWFSLIVLLGGISLCDAQNPVIAAKKPKVQGLAKGVIGLGGHKDVVYSASMDPGGLTSVTASLDKTLRVWDLSTGQMVRELGGPTGHQGIILSVDISPDGKWIASGGMDQTLRLWENPRLESTTLLKVPQSLIAQLPGDQPNTKILVGAKGDLYKQTDKVGDKPVPLAPDQLLPPILGKVTSAVRMASGMLAFATNKGEIAIADAKGKWQRTWQAHEGPIPLLEPGWDGLVSAGVGATIKSWRMDATQSKAWPITPPLARIFAGESDKVLVGPAPGVLEEFRWLKVPTGEKWTDLSGVTDGVLATGGNGPEGPLAMVANKDNQWHVWSGLVKQPKVSLRAPGLLTAMAILPGGRMAVSVEGQGIQHWQPPVGEAPKPIVIAGGIQKLDVVHQGKRLVAHGPGPKLRLIDPPSGRIDREINGPPGLTAIAVSPDGGDFLAGLADGKMLWHRRATGDIWQPGFGVHDGPVQGVAWLSTGQLVSWDKSGWIKVWKAPWDNGFKAGDKADKFVYKELAEARGGPVLSLMEVEGIVVVLREGGSLEALRIREGKRAPLVGPPGLVARSMTLQGRRALLVDASGRGSSKEDITLVGNWTPILGTLPDAALGPLESGHPERFALTRTLPAGQFVDVYDLKSKAIVGRMGPYRDLRAALIHPSGTQLLAITALGIQAYPLGFEQVVQPEVVKGPVPPLGMLKTISRDGIRQAWIQGRSLFVSEVRGEVAPVSKPLLQEIAKIRFDLDNRNLVLVDTQGRAHIHDAITGEFLQGSPPGIKVSDAFVFSGGQNWLLATDKGLVLSPLSLARWLAAPVGVTTIEIAGGGVPLAALPLGGIARLSINDGKPELPFGVGKKWDSISQSRIQQLVAASSGTEVCLFQIDGKQVASVMMDAPIKRIFFHPGRTWLCVQSEHQVQVFDTSKFPPAPMMVETLRSLGRVNLVKVVDNVSFGGPQSSDLLIPSGTDLLTWKVAADIPAKSIAHSFPIDSVAFDPKGRWVATGTRDGKVSLWDPETGAKAKEIVLGAKPHPFQVYGMAFRPDGGALATAGMDRAIRIYDPQSGQLQREFFAAPEPVPLNRPISRQPLPTSSPDGHQDAIFALAWSVDGKYLASAGADRMIKVWSPTDGKLLSTLADPQLKPSRPEGPLPAHMGWIHALRYVSDGTLLSAGIGPKGMGILRSWKPGQITPLERWVVPQGPLQALVPTPKGDRILIATGHRVRLGNTEENLSLLAPWPFPADWIQTPDSLTVPEPKRKTR